jgi:hypothetical protein
VSGFEILKVTPPPPGVVKKRYGMYIMSLV